MMMNSKSVGSDTPAPPYAGINYSKLDPPPFNDDEVKEHKDQIEMLLRTDDAQVIRKIGSGLVNHDLGYIIIALCVYVYQVVNAARSINHITHMELALLVASTIHIIVGVALYLMRLHPVIGRFMSVHHFFSVFWTVTLLIIFIITSEGGSRFGVRIYCSFTSCNETEPVDTTALSQALMGNKMEERMSEVAQKVNSLIQLIGRGPPQLHFAVRQNAHSMIYGDDVIRESTQSSHTN